MSKHSPYTSEPSKPHSSSSEPKEHVDVHHYGEGGEKDNDLTVSHVTDENMVSYGHKVQEYRENKK